MKFLAIIMTSIIFFLVLKPGFDVIISENSSDIDCCKEICASAHQADHSQEEAPEDNCNGSFCNPFLICGTCFIFNQAITIDGYQNIRENEKQKSLYQFIFPSLFINDFWQPPQFV